MSRLLRALLRRSSRPPAPRLHAGAAPRPSARASAQCRHRRAPTATGRQLAPSFVPTHAEYGASLVQLLATALPMQCELRRRVDQRHRCAQFLRGTGEARDWRDCDGDQRMLTLWYTGGGGPAQEQLALFCVVLRSGRGGTRGRILPHGFVARGSRRGSADRLLVARPRRPSGSPAKSPKRAEYVPVVKLPGFHAGRAIRNGFVLVAAILAIAASAGRTSTIAKAGKEGRLEKLDQQLREGVQQGDRRLVRVIIQADASSRESRKRAWAARSVACRPRVDWCDDRDGHAGGARGPVRAKPCGRCRSTPT